MNQKCKEMIQWDNLSQAIGEFRPETPKLSDHGLTVDPEAVNPTLIGLALILLTHPNKIESGARFGDAAKRANTPTKSIIL